MNSLVKFVLVIGTIGIGLWAYLQFATATLSLTSEPAGAKVLLDGRSKGVTPISRLQLDPGTRVLEVRHSHYATMIQTLEVARGDHLENNVVLVRGSGALELLSNPKGAWVSVNGERLSEVTPTQVTLPSGEHSVAMGLAERKTVEETVLVEDAKQQTANFTLGREPYGSLKIDIYPTNAKLSITPAGKTSSENPHSEAPLSYAANMRLPVGKYVLTASRRGYASEQYPFRVAYGDNEIKLKLQREQATLTVNVQPNHAVVTLRLPGDKQSRPYQPAMAVPTGNVQIRTRAMGYRTKVQNVQVQSSGAVISVKLVRIDITPGSDVIDKLRDGGRGPTMVVIPHGQFTMGNASGAKSEQPIRKITITQPFAMSRYETTVAEYLAYARATSLEMPEKVDIQQADHPMTRITYNQAQAYARWLSEQSGEFYRVPSEAEWEYAARAGSSTQFFFGENVRQLCTYANVADQTTRQTYRTWDTLDCNDGMLRPGKVGAYAANPFGLYDIYGNVSEWVADCGLPDYDRAPTDGSVAPGRTNCDTHGFRGGSWDSTGVEANSSYRNTASRAGDDRGFRLVRVL